MRGGTVKERKERLDLCEGKARPHERGDRARVEARLHSEARHVAGSGSLRRV